MSTAATILGTGTGLSGKATKIEIVRLPVKNFMPPEGVPFRPANYVAIPAQGASAVVVKLLVPQGRNGIINQIANVFVGGGFQEGQGLITWQLWLDGNPNPPLVAPYFNNIVASLGSVANPAQLAGGIAVKENQLVELVVFNANPGVVPAGQLIGGLLGGYFYPKQLEPAYIGF
jgi:hypothetical protein